MLRSHTYTSCKIWRWCIGAGTRFLALMIWSNMNAVASRDLGFVSLLPSSGMSASSRESLIICRQKDRKSSILEKSYGSFNQDAHAFRPSRYQRSRICLAMDAEITRDPTKEIIPEKKNSAGSAGGEYVIERNPTIINQVCIL
jgi:hypothetical protein